MTCKRFELIRTVDHSGTSGIGRVCEGTQFTDGVCVMRWLTNWQSTCIYDSIEDLIAIHGHDGDTYVDWVDR